jgi:thymidylate synthase (FAD)
MSDLPPGSTPVLDHGFVAPILQPDSDLKVVNAARVSFHKVSTWGSDHTIPGGKFDARLSEKDAGLIRYLATHKHWTPFAHIRTLALWCGLTPDTIEMFVNTGGFALKKIPTRDPLEGAWLVSHSLAHAAIDPSFGRSLFHACPVSVRALWATAWGDGPTPPRCEPVPWSEWPEETPATLHIKLPIFVDRQLVTHKVGFVRNEVSRRYLDGDDLPIEFHTPTIWRSRPPKNIKQGSGVEMDYYQHCFDCRSADGDGDTNLSADAVALYEYNERTRCNVAPEQARIVLPVSTYTEHWTTASLRSWARLFHLRSDAHAQHEIQQYARAIDAQLCIMHPEHWPRVRDNR